MNYAPFQPSLPRQPSFIVRCSPSLWDGGQGNIAQITPYPAHPVHPVKLRFYAVVLPMRNTEASQMAQLPRVAGRPFFSVTSTAFFTSRDARHLRQYASINVIPSYLLIRRARLRTDGVSTFKKLYQRLGFF